MLKHMRALQKGLSPTPDHTDELAKIEHIFNKLKPKLERGGARLRCRLDKDGRWEGRYTAGYHPETGKRIIKNVLGRTQAEAKVKLKKAIEDAQGIDVAHADDYTVGTWPRSWYDLYAQPNIRTATADKYRLFIEEYVTPKLVTSS